MNPESKIYNFTIISLKIFIYHIFLIKNILKNIYLEPETIILSTKSDLIKIRESTNNLMISNTNNFFEINIYLK